MIKKQYLIITAIAGILLVPLFIWKGGVIFQKESDIGSDQESLNEQKSQNSPAFEDFKVTGIYSGEVASVDYQSNENALNFRGQIKYQIEEGVNFAGHYMLVSWGCGTNCVAGLVVDAITGKVYSMPLIASCGIDFRLNSSLFILDPGCPQYSELFGVQTTYYKWENTKFIPISY